MWVWSSRIILFSENGLLKSLGAVWTGILCMEKSCSGKMNCGIFKLLWEQGNDSGVRWSIFSLSSRFGGVWTQRKRHRFCLKDKIIKIKKPRKSFSRKFCWKREWERWWSWEVFFLRVGIRNWKILFPENKVRNPLGEISPWQDREKVGSPALLSIKPWFGGAFGEREKDQSFSRECL